MAVVAALLAVALIVLPTRGVATAMHYGEEHRDNDDNRSNIGTLAAVVGVTGLTLAAIASRGKAGGKGRGQVGVIETK